MKESLGISQEQKQVQRLTPQQVQFGKMLEMSQLEIEEKVRQEIEDNPAIEVASPAESEKMLTEDGEVFKESSQDMQLAVRVNRRAEGVSILLVCLLLLISAT